MKKISYLKLALVMLPLLASHFVNAQCLASFTCTSNPNGLVSFTNTSTGTYNTSQWSFGDGTGGWGSNVTHTYNSVGYVTVCLTIFDSLGPCQSTTCDSVLVGNSSGTCASYFTVSPVGGTTSFQFWNASTGNFTSTSWDFGDSTYSTLSDPLHTFSQPGTYTVCLTVANALAQCNSTYCYIVTITGGGTTCNAQFGHQNTGTNYSFYSANTQGLLYTWTFGDGGNSSLANPTHQYLVAGNYIVCLTVTDSAQTCSDTYCDSISINSTGNCQANFSASFNPALGIVSFTDASTGGASAWSWDFGDSTYSSSQNPTHQYASNGVYYVCLTISSFLPACTSTYCAYVTVGNSTSCNAYFTSMPDTSNGVQFTNASSGNFIGQVWSFGDNSPTSSQANPFHQYANSGAYLVCLSIYVNGAICDSYCDSIVVGNPASSCVPVFYSYPDSTFGSGVVYFGFFNNCPGTQYVWDFGDSTSGSGLNPVHQYADSGWFEVCVTAYSALGTFTYCDSVFANRMAGFSGLTENANNYYLSIYPNPLAATGTATFNLQTGNRVKLDLYSIDGKYISNLVDANMQAGVSKIQMDVASLQNGMYLIRLNVNDSISYQKFSVLK